MLMFNNINMAEPGSTEGAVAPKPSEPDSFYARQKGGDLPSFAEAGKKLAENTTAPTGTPKT